jgi:hypothetical protein
VRDWDRAQLETRLRLLVYEDLARIDGDSRPGWEQIPGINEDVAGGSWVNLLFDQLRSVLEFDLTLVDGLVVEYRGARGNNFMEFFGFLEILMQKNIFYIFMDFFEIFGNFNPKNFLFYI